MITQYEIWEKDDDHSGYPMLITKNPKVAEEYEVEGYEVKSYEVYPLI